MATVLALTLKEIRMEKGMKQSAVAEYLGMTTAGWGKLENGKTLLSVESMDCACSALGLSPIKLLERVYEQIDLLKHKGWEVRDKRTDNDGLILGLGIPESLVASASGALGASTAGLNATAGLGGVLGAILGAGAGAIAGAVAPTPVAKDKVDNNIAPQKPEERHKFGKVISKAISGYGFIEKTKKL